MARALLAVCALCVWLPVSAHAAADDGLLRGHESVVQRNRHGLGLVGGVSGSNGFAYRRYFGNHALQVNVLPVVLDRGDYLSVHLGAQFIEYMLVWSRGRNSFSSTQLSSTALRLVANVGLSLSREQGAIEVDAANCKTRACQDLLNAKAPIDRFMTAGIGFGLEFGAVTRAGFSVSVDVLMTGMWDQAGFYAASPLPYAALMYSW